MGQPARFENVLVGVDGTSTGRDAITLANRLGACPGRLTLAHVIVVDVPRYRNFHSTPAWKEAREMLEHQSEATGVTAELTGMFAPSVGSGLHQLAEDCDADLIVVGSATRGRIGRVLIGDGARGTISGATRPVAVAPHGYADRSGEIRTIGVAYNEHGRGRGGARRRPSAGRPRRFASSCDGRGEPPFRPPPGNGMSSMRSARSSRPHAIGCIHWKVSKDGLRSAPPPRRLSGSVTRSTCWWWGREVTDQFVG